MSELAFDWAESYDDKVYIATTGSATRIAHPNHRIGNAFEAFSLQQYQWATTLSFLWGTTLTLGGSRSTTAA